MENNGAYNILDGENGKRLFIIGASRLQLPAIIAAKKLNMTVAVADQDTEAAGIAYADEFYNVSTIDEEGIYRAAENFGADGIITLATDMPMRSLAYACEKLGLCGISTDTALVSTDKGKMMDAFARAELPIPRYIVFENEKDAVNRRDKLMYPCVLKPVDNSGSRGVILVKSEDEFTQAAHYSTAFSRCGRIIAEEYMSGSEVSVELVVNNGETYVITVTDKLTTGEPHFVELGHSQPSRLPKSIIENVEKLAKDAVKAVNIENGTAHVEIMVTKDGARLIELGARMGGDCITTHLVPLSTGVDMVRANIDISLGLKPMLSRYPYKHSRGSAILFICSEQPYHIIQAFEGIEKAREVKGIKEVCMTASVGVHTSELQSSSDRIGYVIAEGENAENAMESCRKAVDMITIL